MGLLELATPLHVLRLVLFCFYSYLHSQERCLIRLFAARPPQRVSTPLQRHTTGREALCIISVDSSQCKNSDIRVKAWQSQDQCGNHPKKSREPCDLSALKQKRDLWFLAVPNLSAAEQNIDLYYLAAPDLSAPEQKSTDWV